MLLLCRQDEARMIARVVNGNSHNQAGALSKRRQCIE
jgi:hypothetical protein